MIRLTTTEEQEHRAFIEYVRLMEWKYPDLKMLFHVPNGGKRPKGEAGKMQALGQKAGVLDFLLLAPRGHCHGFALELKVPGGRTSIEQLNWIAELQERGYCAEIRVGWEKAWAATERYLRMGK